MKTFKKTAAQGEINSTRIDKLPKDVVEVKPVNGSFIIGHSETGHHHTLEASGCKVFEAKNPPSGMKVLYAVLEQAKSLTHDRSFDTHESLNHEPGIYEFRIGREHDHYADLARRQAD
jgi:hypothetical protein